MSTISKNSENVDRYTNAVNEIACDSLTLDEQAALARLLVAYIETEGEFESQRTADYCEYQGAVDFLWMANRIDLNQKFALLDLLG